MALSIVRNDITRMAVDAIVNSTNEHLLVGGSGVDASIHYAAGPELADALREIGHCPTGSCVITDSYGLSTCRYIIHAVGPVWDSQDTAHRGEAYHQLQNCYRAIFAAARERGCRSVAMPLISAGANGFAKEIVYQTATSIARDFLLSLREDEEDMMVYIVLFGSESVGISRRVNDAVQHYISDTYPDTHREELDAFYSSTDTIGSVPSVATVPQAAPAPSGKSRRVFSNARRPEHRANKARREEPTAMTMAETAGFPAYMAEPTPPEDYRSQDRSFPEMCEWWCQQKGLSKHDFYTYSNITKATFWSMKNNPGQVPKKTNVLACAIGLRLDLDQTKDLLMRAGLALSPYYPLDMIVEYYITNHRYDIYEINAVLFDEDLALLGTVAREKL